MKALKKNLMRIAMKIKRRRKRNSSHYLMTLKRRLILRMSSKRSTVSQKLKKSQRKLLQGKLILPRFLPERIFLAFWRREQRPLTKITKTAWWWEQLVIQMSVNLLLSTFYVAESVSVSQLCQVKQSISRLCFSKTILETSAWWIALDWYFHLSPTPRLRCTAVESYLFKILESTYPRLVWS